MALPECLAETHASKESEPVPESGRTSVAAKLPKLGFFSTSKFTSETDVTAAQTSTERKFDKLPSKPPSRQRLSRGESPIVTAQRLDIRIDLPNATSVVTARQSCNSGRSLNEEKVKNKNVSNTPQILKRSKDKDKRLRTKTWPSLQYNLWLGASNLPIHLLCNDERANRPTEDLHFKERGSSQVKMVGMGTSGSSKAASAGRNINELSTHCLSISKPPVRADMSNSGTPLRRMRKGSQESTREATASGLRFDAGQSWQVTSSYAHRRSRDDSLSSSSNEPQGLACLTGHLTKPRLPSRMGRNNLEVFLKQNRLFDVASSRVGETNDTAAEKTSTLSSKLPAVFSTTRQFCNTSAEVNLLSLRSYARNPRVLQEVMTEREQFEHFAALNKKDVVESTSPNKLERESKSNEDTSAQSTHTAARVGGIKQVRFKVPCGMDEDSGTAKGLMAKTSTRMKNSNTKQLQSDVTPPPTPPTFEQAYRIKCYITPRIRSGSSE